MGVMLSEVPPPKDPITEPGPWNTVANGYDEVFFGQAPRLIDTAIDLLAPEAEDTVLDIATGPGTLAVRLAPRVRRVVAIDFADAMIARLHSHRLREHVTNLEAHVMDGQALTFEDASFDLVVSMFGVFLFADRARGLSEMFRVVVPGGRALFTSWAPPEQNTLLGMGMEALRAALPELPRPKGPLPTQIPDVCAAELAAAGFEQVGSRVVTEPLGFASVEAYWDGFERASAPLALLRNKLDDDDFARVRERVLTALGERCGQGRFTLEAAAIFTSGERGLSAA
jgi:SAM-dependent methyltransferase